MFDLSASASSKVCNISDEISTSSAITFATDDTFPTELILPPTMLPVALINPLTCKLEPLMLPAVVKTPFEIKLPPVMFPETLMLFVDILPETFPTKLPIKLKLQHPTKLEPKL